MTAVKIFIVSVWQGSPQIDEQQGTWLDVVTWVLMNDDQMIRAWRNELTGEVAINF